jgi:ribulose kinase
VGNGLTQKSADEMGLHPRTAVATSLIDAHAGGVGMLGADINEVRGQLSRHVTSRLALIGGTSTCHMAVSSTPVYVPGVWGPYYSAMLPGYYLSEGGQSTTGQLLDHILQSNSSLFTSLKRTASLNHRSVYKELEHTLHNSSQHLPHPSLLTSHLHIVPDFHGNRSPLADPTILGMVSGRSMIHTIADLSVFYLAAVQALAVSVYHYTVEGSYLPYMAVRNSVVLCGSAFHLPQSSLFELVCRTGLHQ